MRTLSSILERKRERRKALEESLAWVVEQLKALGALKVILFGSLARGDVGPHSDLDLIAVTPTVLSSREWMNRIYSEVDRGIACDILVYTEADLQEMFSISRFLRHVLKEGEVVYEAASSG